MKKVTTNRISGHFHQFAASTAGTIGMAAASFARAQTGLSITLHIRNVESIPAFLLKLFSILSPPLSQNKIS